MYVFTENGRLINLNAVQCIQVSEMLTGLYAVFADAVSSSHTSILVRDLAKLIKQNGIDMGEKRLYEWLRNKGYLIKGGSDKNMPTQMAMNLKLFEIKEGNYIDGRGSNHVTRTPKVTDKGQVYFVNKFLAK